MTMPDLGRVPVGGQLDGPFLVCDLEQRGGSGQPFVVLTLGNGTGRISTAPFWKDATPPLPDIARGDVVRVVGQVGVYRERRQLRVTAIHPLPAESVEWSQLLPSAGDPTPCWNALDRWRADIAGPRLRATLDLFYSDEAFRRRYQCCPASINGHHAQLGGLLRHTWEVASIGMTLCQVSPADPDLVLAGALLHDIGKLEAYTWERGFGFSDRGHLYGHVALGAIMLEREYLRASPRPCSQDELDLLQHLVLSHHGKPEYGAPIRPMTLEAEVLHYADDASARTDSMHTALNAADHFGAGELTSTRGIWQLDGRRVFRGKTRWGT
jgi:3'-5' exoribonuclease